MQHTCNKGFRSVQHLLSSSSRRTRRDAKPARHSSARRPHLPATAVLEIGQAVVRTVAGPAAGGDDSGVIFEVDLGWGRALLVVVVVAVEEASERVAEGVAFMKRCWVGGLVFGYWGWGSDDGGGCEEEGQGAGEGVGEMHFWWGEYEG